MNELLQVKNLPTGDVSQLQLYYKNKKIVRVTNYPYYVLYTEHGFKFPVRGEQIIEDRSETEK